MTEKPVESLADGATLRTLRWLVLPHTFRLFGVVLLLQVAAGALSPEMIAPAAMAVVAGASAPLVVRALRSGGVAGWGWALAWNTWGMADLIVGWTTVLIVRPPLLGELPWLLFPRLFGPVLFLLHLWCTRLLLRPEIRAGYSQAELADRTLGAVG